MRLIGTSLLGQVAALAGDVTMNLWPSGMQGTSRRNAWAAMVNDNTKARSRAEADIAIRAALANAAIDLEPLTALP